MVNFDYFIPVFGIILLQKLRREFYTKRQEI